jgi:hypothetical protein
MAEFTSDVMPATQYFPSDDDTHTNTVGNTHKDQVTHCAGVASSSPNLRQSTCLTGIFDVNRKAESRNEWVS